MNETLHRLPGKLGHWLRLAWFILLGATIVQFVLPFLAPMLVFLVVTIPFSLLLWFAPTTLLYLTLLFVLLAAIEWANRSGRLSAWASLGIAVLLSGAIGWSAAVLLDREHDRRLKALATEDGGERPLLARRNGIALVAGHSPEEGRCWGNCQRLLYRGVTPYVLVGDEAMLDAVREGRKRRVMRHRLISVAAGCNRVFLGQERLPQAEWGKAADPPFIWDYREILEQRGLCLRSEWIDDPRADIYLLDHIKSSNSGRGDEARSWFELFPRRTWWRQTFLERQGRFLRPIYQATAVESARISRPLVILPPLAFATYTPGGPVTDAAVAYGQRNHEEQPLDNLIRDDLRLPELVAWGGALALARRPPYKRGQ